MCPRLYTACHLMMFQTAAYTCRKPTTCLLCLVDDGYPHAIVTEEYEPL